MGRWLEEDGSLLTARLPTGHTTWPHVLHCAIFRVVDVRVARIRGELYGPGALGLTVEEGMA